MPQAFNFKHVTSTGVNTIGVAQFGMLHGIVLNQISTGAVTSTGGFITIYNGTTTAASTDASVIAICNPTLSGVPEWIYDCLCPAGLTLQVGSVVAPLDLTIMYTS